MIIKLHKYLIFGSGEDMDLFFSLSQRAGFIEFIGPQRKKTLELPAKAKTFLAAIKIAKHYPTHPHEAPSTPLSIDKIAEKIVSLKCEQEALLEQERVTIAEIDRISVFGDFSRPELDLLEKESRRVFQFFCMKSDLASELTLPPELIHIGTEYDLDYFVSINQEKTQYPKMIEILIDHPVGELRTKLLELREDLAKLESDIRTFANTLPDLQSGLVELLNEHNLKLAKHSATLNLNSALFAIEAWIPETKVKSLLGLISTLKVDCEEIAIEKRDQIPTYLENIGAGKVGEDVVLIFDTPSHTDKDPSLWVLIFFSLFFSMIMSDAGYGLIFLLMTLALKWKFPHLQGVKKRVLKLSFILSVCTILWGIATASYFGISIAPNSPIQKTSILAYLAKKKANYHLQEKDDTYREIVKDYPEVADARSANELFLKGVQEEEGTLTYALFGRFLDNILMEFSFLIGIIHIALSFIRYMGRNWAGAGWIIFMIGGYLYLPSIVGATVLPNFMGWVSKSVAYYWGLRLMIGGIGLAFIAALIKQRWGAFHEMLHAVQIFADTLSYLRLYALALGGMVIAHTFNDAFGIRAGILATLPIILTGHTVNIGLCLMGSVIHGLRLNFLEWFRYSFEGGGRLFNPLKLNRTK